MPMTFAIACLPLMNRYGFIGWGQNDHLFHAEYHVILAASGGDGYSLPSSG
jgi:hypothetical protein